MSKKRRIVQIVPVMSYGDAIGNNILAMDDAFQEAGFESLVYADVIDSRVRRRNVIPFSRLRDREDQLIIYHLGTGSPLSREAASLRGKFAIHYHNITPPEFFEGYSMQIAKACREGLQDVAWLKDKPAFCIADSEFNRQDLIRMGYTCPIEVVPILIAFEDYRKKPDQTVIDQYRKEGLYNIVFTGRVAPNKKQEDLIRSFYYYHKHYNPSSMLHIVGGDSGGLYSENLARYVECLGLEDSVHFTGHVPFSQILSYYRLADLFLCLSEHEGFCVPLVEAMFFRVPIIAYDAAAVGDTLGDGGILLNDKDPRFVAETIHYLKEHGELEAWLKRKEKERLNAFSHSVIKEKLFRILDHYYPAR